MQVLLSQPQNELVKRVNSLGLSCNTHSRQQLTEVLTTQLLDKERVLSEWEKLNDKEKHLLLQMCFRQAIMSISQHELKICLKQEDREKFPIVLETLKQKGWVYEDESRCILIPQELKENIHKIVLNEWSIDFIFVPLKKQQEYTIIQDVFEFMDIVEEKSIPLTKK